MKPLNLQPLYLSTQPGRVIAYRDRNGRIPAREWPMSQRECPLGCAAIPHQDGHGLWLPVAGHLDRSNPTRSLNLEPVNQ